MIHLVRLHSRYPAKIQFWEIVVGQDQSFRPARSAPRAEVPDRTAEATAFEP